MIQKRYEYWKTENGKPVKKFTSWFDFSDDNSQLDRLNKNESKQIGKLKNEYRIV